LRRASDCGLVGQFWDSFENCLSLGPFFAKEQARNYSKTAASDLNRAATPRQESLLDRTCGVLVLCRSKRTPLVSRFDHRALRVASSPTTSSLAHHRLPSTRATFTLARLTDPNAFAGGVVASLVRGADAARLSGRGRVSSTRIDTTRSRDGRLVCCAHPASHRSIFVGPAPEVFGLTALARTIMIQSASVQRTDGTHAEASHHRRRRSHRGGAEPNRQRNIGTMSRLSSLGDRPRNTRTDHTVSAPLLHSLAVSVP
jgi:hypothetical protein